MTRISGSESKEVKKKYDAKSLDNSLPAYEVESDNTLGDFYLKNGSLKKDKGLHWFIASLFIIADMVGAGIVALPKTISDCAFYPGMAIMIFMAIVATASAVILGKAWVIMLRIFPSYRTHCRKPYSEMGFRSCGKYMKIAVSACLNLTQFGIGITFLLIVSENTREILKALGVAVQACHIIVIVAIMLIPVLLLKSPQNFWQVIVLSMVSTLIAVVFIVIGSILDFTEVKLSSIKKLEKANILPSLGVYLFTFGGHSALPTIQHDMRRPSDFTRASIFAFIGIALINSLVATVSIVSYGIVDQDSVIMLINTPWARITADILIVAHCVLAYPLMINPLNQEIEEFFKISQRFGFKRVAVRISLLLLITFCALSLPSFNSMMRLLGSSTLTITSFIFPPIFYLFLSVAEQKKNELSNCSGMKKISKFSYSDDGTDDSLRQTVSLKEVIQKTPISVLSMCGMIITVGGIFGIVATYYALVDIATIGGLPCYFKKQFYPWN